MISLRWESWAAILAFATSPGAEVQERATWERSVQEYPNSEWARRAQIPAQNP